MGLLDFIPIVGDVLGGVFDTINTNNQISANNAAVSNQLSAQANENEKTREFNAQQAALQNRWNVEQWQRESAYNMEMYEKQKADSLAQWSRENAYNSPAAQMSRYKQAGLNPNLIYGQSNTSGSMSMPTIAASSAAGSMTSSRANPQDMSALGRKQNYKDLSGLSSMFRSLGKSMLEIPEYKERVRGARLENDLKEEQLWRSKFDTAFEDFIANSPLSEDDINKKLDAKVSPRIRKYLLGLIGDSADNKIKTATLTQQEFQNKVNSATFNDIVKKFQAEANKAVSEAGTAENNRKVSFEEAKNAVEYFVYRNKNLKLQNETEEHRRNLAEKEAFWYEIFKIADIGVETVECLIEAASFVMSVKGGKFGAPPAKGITINNYPRVSPRSRD